MYDKLFILILIIKIIDAMKIKNSKNLKENPVKKRPYPYIIDDENKIILEQLINKNLKFYSLQYNVEDYLIKKTDNINLKDNVNSYKKLFNESNSINNDILNNSLYSIINKIDDDQEKINIICEEHDIINMINRESNNNIILHTKNNQKMNKKIPIDKNKDKSEKNEFNNENLANNNKYKNNNNLQKT